MKQKELNETQNINYGVMDFTLCFWTLKKSGDSG